MKLNELKALSIWQPWAWAIVHAGKDFENREWAPKNPGRKFSGEFLIHAAKGMTRDEYAAGAAMIDNLPPFEDLQRGGIIGRARVVDFVERSDSDWSFGPGLVLADAKPLPFMPCKGMLGFFKPELLNVQAHVTAGKKDKP